VSEGAVEGLPHKAGCQTTGEVKVGDRLMLENVANIDEYQFMHNGTIVDVQSVYKRAAGRLAWLEVRLVL
jgi:hypothetical protein